MDEKDNILRVIVAVTSAAAVASPLEVGIPVAAPGILGAIGFTTTATVAVPAVVIVGVVGALGVLAYKCRQSGP